MPRAVSVGRRNAQEAPGQDTPGYPIFLDLAESSDPERSDKSSPALDPAPSHRLNPFATIEISRNNFTFHSSSTLWVFGREFTMILKMVIAPLSFVSLAVLFVFTEPHIPCVFMVLAKFAGQASL
jgi:hypothetical protein